MTTTFECKNARIIDNHVYGLKVTTVRQVTNDQKETVKDLKVTIDFEGIPVDELAKFATATLVIRRQNGVWKKQTPEQIKLDNGKVINWKDMGKGGESAKAPNMIVILSNIMIGAGMAEEEAINKATELASNPVKMAEMLSKAGILPG